MDVGDAVQDYLSVEALGDVFDFYIWSGTPCEALTAYGTLTGLPIFPPEWVFEPWAGGGGGRWRNGPLQDIALEQMAAMKSSMNSIFRIPAFMQKEQELPFMENIKRGIIQSCIVWRTSWIQGVFLAVPNMTQELAQELLPECPKEELPITRNKNDEEEKLPVYIDFSHPRAKELLAAQWKDRMDAGIRGSMVDFGDVVPDEAVFMMEDAAMRCITRMPISMRKIIESYLNKNMEMTMFFIQEALHPDLNTLRVSSAGIS